MDLSREKERLSEEIRMSRTALLALGNETRQHIISVILREMDNRTGMRVNEIAERANLSRSATAFHLKILRAAGIMDVRHDGRKSYYFFSENTETLSRLIQMLRHARELLIRSASLREQDDLTKGEDIT